MLIKLIRIKLETFLVLCIIIHVHTKTLCSVKIKLHNESDGQFRLLISTECILVIYP